MVYMGQAIRDDIKILGQRSVSVCLYVYLCVQSVTISKFPWCPLQTILSACDSYCVCNQVVSGMSSRSKPHFEHLSLSERGREADGADVGDGCVHVVLHVRDAPPGALRDQEVRDGDVLQQDHRHLHRHHLQPLPQEEPG